MKATAKLLRNPKTTGGDKAPKKLVIRVTFNRVSRFYSIYGEKYKINAADVEMTEAEFNAARKKEVKIAVDEGNRCLAIAESIIEELDKDFTFLEFKKEYDTRCKGKIIDKGKFEDFAKSYIAKIEKIGTKKAYETAVTAFLTYNAKLKLADITPSLIDDFAKWLKDEGSVHRSENTKRIYLRELKAIYNAAVKEEYVKDRKPFRNQVSTSVGRAKTIIEDEDLSKILGYETTNQGEENAIRYFKLFLWFGGMNLVDLLSVKNKDIQGDMLVYVRQKTEEVDTQVQVIISEEAREIMNTLGRINPEKPDSYVFPVFHDGDSTVTQYNKKKTFCKKLNAAFADICKSLGIPKFTTYNIRHTAGSSLRDSGWSKEQIQKILGHTSSRTTEKYLDSINKKTLRGMSETLGNLGKKE